MITFPRHIIIRILGTAVVSAFMACSSMEDELEAPQQQRPIGFGVVEDNDLQWSRSTSKMTEDFCVTAIGEKDGETFSYFSDELYFVNKLSYISSGAYADYYWPGDAQTTLKFYAYPPDSEVPGMSVINMPGEAPKIKYTLPMMTRAQTDLVAAVSSTYLGNGLPQSGKGTQYASVPLSFKHICCSLEFYATDSDFYTILGFTVSNVKGAGVYDMGTQKWTPLGTARSVQGGVTTLMIPQTFVNAKITVQFMTMYGTVSSRTKYISGTWKAGCVYKYYINF